tara:strand:- start:1528 stop:4020 length:2493 start_codon:yes stop_codon:yes gene_type:complete
MFGSKINPSGAKTDVGDAIANSLRLNDDDSAYLSRTPSSPPTNSRKTWTLSMWIKRSELATYNPLFFGGTSSNYCMGYFGSDDKLAFLSELSGGATIKKLVTSRVFRDTTSWYHLVFVLDTANSTESDRMILYVNGVRQTDFDTETYRTQDDEPGWNDEQAHSLGRDNSTGFFDGYIAKVEHFANQALAPTSFGRFSTSHGNVWVPIETTASFATNSVDFQLLFGTAPGSGAGAGDDTSGRTNDWAENNFASSDQNGDTPTNNFPTMSALCPDFSDGGTWSEGNMKIVSTSEDSDVIWTAPAISSGKHFFQWDFTNNASSGNMRVGMSNLENFNGHTFNYSSSAHLVLEADHRNDNWNKYDGSYSSEDAGNPNATGRYCMAVDFDAGKCWFGLIDTSDGSITWYDNSNGSSGNPASGANPVFTFTANTPLVAHVYAGKASGTSWTVDLDFGQFGFGNTVLPTGYTGYGQSDWEVLADVGGIEKPGDFFQTTTYTGNGTAIGSGGKAVTGVGLQPDWVWIKNRDASDSHALYDVVRGTTKQVETDTTAIETTEAEGLSTFGLDGFTLGSLPEVNTSSENLISWNFAAGTAFSNDASETSIGTLDSSGRVSAADHFSIVSWTGTASHGATVKHGMSGTPEFIIAIARNESGSNKPVYHKFMTSDNDHLKINENNAQGSAGTTIWDESAMSSTVIGLGAEVQSNSTNGMIAFCFRSVPGMCKVDQYLPTNATNGPYVNLGFSPAFLLIKCISTTNPWIIFDNARNTFNPVTAYLLANSDATEGTSGRDIDFLSNGFKIREDDSDTNGGTSNAYLYLALSEAAIGGGIPNPTAR